MRCKISVGVAFSGLLNHITREMLSCVYVNSFNKLNDITKYTCRLVL
jgi:hypothetical protein